MPKPPPEAITDAEVETIMRGMVNHGVLTETEFKSSTVRVQAKHICSMIVWLANTRTL